MYYVIFSSYRDGDNILEKRLAVRDEHITRIEALNEAGRILVAGPCLERDEDPKTTGFIGSTIIAEFDCLEEAKVWANEEPFFKAGVYKEPIVRPFVCVFSNQAKK